MVDMRKLSRRGTFAAALTGVGLAMSGSTPGASADSAPDPTGREGMIDVRALGAVGDGRADDTVAVQRAIDRAAAGADGGTVWFPPGRYAVRALSCVNRDRDAFHPVLRLLGAGPSISSIVPLTTDQVLVDASGRSGLRIEALSIDSSRLLSRIGLLLARRREAPNCNGAQLRDVRIEGAFAHAAAVSIAAESMVWSGCHLQNSHLPARSACLVIGASPDAAGLADASALVGGPNTDNRFFGCTFFAPYNGARPVQICEAAGLMLFGCAINTGDAADVRLVTYRPWKGIFNGPVGWNACHFEALGRDVVVHALEAPTGVSYFNSVQCAGGAMVVASGAAQVDYDRADGTRQPVLRNWRWQSPATPPGVAGVDMIAYLLNGCTVDARTGADTGDLVALGALDGCEVQAIDVRTPQVVGKPLRLASKGAPGRGTYPTGAVIDNTDGAAATPAGWRVAPGGAGTIAGTGPGNDGSRGAGRGPSSLRPGDLVTYGGAPHTLWYVSPDGTATIDGSPPTRVPLARLQPRAPVLIAQTAC